MRDVITKVYHYDELTTEPAKAKARDWMREAEEREFGLHPGFYDTIKTAARLIGIEFAPVTVKTIGGKHRTEPCINWSLEGVPSASFRGTYQPAKGSVNTVIEEFPQDEQLHSIARVLDGLQRKHGYAITAKVSTTGGTSFISQKMYIEMNDIPLNPNDAFASVELQILSAMGMFAQWIIDRIQADYDYQISDECIAETIRANEYEFTAEGERFTA